MRVVEVVPDTHDMFDIPGTVGAATGVPRASAPPGAAVSVAVGVGVAVPTDGPVAPPTIGDGVSVTVGVDVGVAVRVGVGDAGDGAAHPEH